MKNPANPANPALRGFLRGFCGVLRGFCGVFFDLTPQDFCNRQKELRGFAGLAGFLSQSTRARSHARERAPAYSFGALGKKWSKTPQTPQTPQTGFWRPDRRGVAMCAP